MKKWPWLLLSLLVICIDQLSKFWAATQLLPYQPEPLLPMVNFTLAYNTGAAFSFLSNAGGWQRWLFAIFSLVMSAVLLIWLLRTPKHLKLQLTGISLVLGGAIGNLYDRAIVGYVVDFIQVYYKNFYWPVFNIADSAICIGAFLLLLDLSKNSCRQRV
ncbi:signal peptidase II [Legionella gresilensis]|uniref:signal peptidase II n=1 Tax=Legionella gresilensis TaxID=91823 RepID=UPI0010416830|nr:signal peptidase II [Legionella gresilensis]